MLVDGIKTVETRAATAKYRNLEAGDEVTAKCGSDRHTLKIAKATHFNTVEEMLDDYNFKKILPNAKSERDVAQMYATFPRYKQKIARSGIMAFELS